METVNLEALNDKQREVVEISAGHTLVLAGAGSGKTRVLVNRIAWLVQSEEASPHSILAVTFTNKAAAEMRHRLRGLLGSVANEMWVGTFHSLAHRFLRLHWQAADLLQDFQILDQDDQHRLVKRIVKSLNLDEKQWVPRKLQGFINRSKDAGLRPEHIDDRGEIYVRTQVQVYRAYEETCQRGGLVDFSELLLRIHEVLLKDKALLQHYRERFKYVLVDEFQDTNTIQYAWLKLLIGPGEKGTVGQLMVVGDDDQSIYSWRGAQIENIRRFSQDFVGAGVIRLEENYRSTKYILDAANGLIQYNPDRLGKQLWTAKQEGEPVVLYQAFNDLDEVRFIVRRIQDHHTDGKPYTGIAVLYRSNAQSRIVEEMLMQHNIPYRVYGGLRFFDRAEIKDILAYLRLLVNRHDDAAFERIFNLPTRGLGSRSVEVLRQIAREREISLWDAANYAITDSPFASRARSKLQDFLDLIKALTDLIQGQALPNIIEDVMQKSGLLQHHGRTKDDKAQSRLENLQELVNAAKQFQQEESLEDNGLKTFLSHAVLESGEEQASEHQDYVQLMTVHAAKGLEFPVVFIAGLAEGLFPHGMSLEEPDRILEERRLCYVGMTRAMQKLYLSYAEIGRQYGKEIHFRPSRFLREIPSECIQEIRLRTKAERPPTVERVARFKKNTEIGDTVFRVGQTVHHPKFGDGVILDYEGSDAHTRVQVRFKREESSKWLVLAYAKLEAA